MATDGPTPGGGGEPTESIPAQVGDYQVERLLANGVLGAVYLVRSPRLPRREVLKVLREDLSGDPAMLARFEQEADVTAGLEHPNIVRMYDRGEAADGQRWITREYVAGLDAESVLKSSGPVPRHRALHILTEVARALDAAHRLGVVHQDIKPSNILLGEQPGEPERVVLSDFGSAPTRDSTEVPGRAGGPIAATLAYAAPEVITGAPVDGRADVYSLGCTLFRLLTGKHPFPVADNVAEIVKAHLGADAPLLSAHLPWATPQMDTLIATALAKDPARRYATAGDLAAAAQQTMAPHRPTQATPATPAAAAAISSPRPSPVPSPAPSRRPRVPAPAADEPSAWSGSTDFLDDLPRPQPVAAAARRRRQIGMLAAIGGGLLAAGLIIGLALPARTPVSTEPTQAAASSSTAASTDPAAESKLTALLPTGYPSGRCSATDKGADAHLASARLTCGASRDPAGPPLATYTLARNQEALQSLFATETGGAETVLCPGNIASPGAWHRTANPSVPVGTVFCGTRAGGQPVVAWTVDDSLLLSVIGAPSAAGPTLDQLFTWWASHST